MSAQCIGDPPVCCQPEPLTYREALRRAAGNLPTRCPWLGHVSVCPAFALGRNTFWCWGCKREWTLCP